MLKNIDRQLPVSDGISSTTLLDSSTKSLMNMTDQEKEDLIYNAVTERSHGTDSVQQLPQSTESRFSEISPSGLSVSKNMKLIRKHTLMSDEPNSRMSDNIQNYLHYQPAADENDPVAFWRKGLFPGLEKTAMKCLI